jgi:hypothetical protein
MRAALLLALPLAGCASAPVRSPFPAALAVSAPGPWETGPGEGWYHAGDRYLHVRATEGLAAGAATRELDALRAALGRRLETQVDPYYGTRAESRYCASRGQGERHGTPGGGTAQAFSLAADKDRLIDCYSAGARYRARVLHLYCPEARALFDVELFTPLQGGESAAPVADCR